MVYWYLIGAVITFLFALFRLYLFCRKAMITKQYFTDELFEIFVFAFIFWFIYWIFMIFDFIIDKLYEFFTK